MDFKYVNIGLIKYLITASYDLYYEHQPRLTLNVHFIWPMELSNLVNFLERFGNIAAINDKVLSNYGFFIPLRFSTISTKHLIQCQLLIFMSFLRK